jgi:error-prone DNA polymerase
VHCAEVPYVELEAQSNFTFLEGASHPEELAQQAARLGQPAIAICDTNSLAGIVRAHVAAKDAGIRAIVGCRLRLSDPLGLEVLVYPANRDAYGFVCRLLSLGKRRATKGSCELTLADLRQCPEGLIAIGVPPAVGPAKVREWGGHVPALRAIFPKGRLSLAVCRWFDAFDEDRMECIAAIGKREGVPLVATNDVLYHVPHRRPLQDVLACIRLGTTIEDGGLCAARQRRAAPQVLRRDGASLRTRCPTPRAKLAIAERTRGLLARPTPLRVSRRGLPAGTFPGPVSARTHRRRRR